jgi:hypothetical protein
VYCHYHPPRLRCLEPPNALRRKTHYVCAAFGQPKVEAFAFTSPLRKRGAGGIYSLVFALKTLKARF